MLYQYGRLVCLFYIGLELWMLRDDALQNLSVS